MIPDVSKQAILKERKSAAFDIPKTALFSLPSKETSLSIQGERMVKEW